jgi:hypothetical protein
MKDNKRTDWKKGVVMSDKIESSNSTLENFLDWYESNVVLRVGAIALIPATHGVSHILDAGLTGTLAYLRKVRMRTFGNELIELNIGPSEEEVKSREFMEGFLATASRVVNTKREEKIKLFARLFKSYWDDKQFDLDSYDKYEEDLAIVDELGHREFFVLVVLDEFESKNPLEPGANRLQRAQKFWPEFESKVAKALDITVDEVQAYLQRLTRSGLYQPIVGTYLNYAGGRGYLTPRFEKLKRRLGPFDLNTIRTTAEE